MNPAEKFLLFIALFAALVGIPILVGALLHQRAARRHPITIEFIPGPPPIPAADQVDIVAQAIARCYGHGPLDRMHQTYQDEFRRDARAALAAMRRRT